MFYSERWCWWRCDFQISFSGSDIIGNVWNRLLGSSMVGTREIIKLYEAPISWMLYDILEHDHMQSHAPLNRYYTNSWPFTELDLITELPFYQIAKDFHSNECGIPTEDGRLVLRTPDSVPFGICICFNVKTSLSWTCLVSESISLLTAIHFYQCIAQSKFMFV